MTETKIMLMSKVPIYQRYCRFSISERELGRDKIQSRKEGGVNRDSNSAYASSIVLIPKNRKETFHNLGLGI